MTEGAVLDYARLKPSHLNRWLPARLPDLPSSQRTERNNLPPYFTSLFSVLHILTSPPSLFRVTPLGRHRVTSWLPQWMFGAQEVSEKVIEKVSCFFSSCQDFWHLLIFLFFFFFGDLKRSSGKKKWGLNLILALLTIWVHCIWIFCITVQIKCQVKIFNK